MIIIKIIVSLLPILIFLCALVLYDSFKLVSFKSIFRTVLWGSIAAVICFALNRWFINLFEFELFYFARYGAPIIEESVKAIMIIYLIRSSNIGFMVDAAILGCAVGAGFAIIENIYYLQNNPDLNLFVWMLRGLGTAIMHGTATAVFAVFSKFLVDRLSVLNFYIYLPGLLIAIMIHSIFNHLLIPAQMITILQIIVLPIIFWLIFIRSEKALHNWLELGLDTEVGLLEFLTSGAILKTKVGQYLQSLKDVFSGEIIADMICYLRIYLELSIRAKGILMMQQNGFDVIIDSGIQEKLDELKYLEKSIGKTGKRMMGAIYRADQKELWQLYLLYSKHKK